MMSPEALQLLLEGLSLVATEEATDTKTSFRQRLKRALFLLSMILTLLTTFHSLNWNPKLKLSDRLFMLTVFFCHVFLLIQTLILWKHRKNLLNILRDMERINNFFCQNDIFQRYDIDFHEKPYKVLKLCAK